MSAATVWTGHRESVSVEMLTTDPEALNRLMEFDHPITVSADGIACDEHPEGLYAPSALHDSDAEVILVAPPGTWELLTGHTGQYSYNGAIMHASEFIGGGLARDILNTPGIYVAIAVECEPDDDDGDRWPGDSPETRQADYSDGTWRPEPAGWAVARWIGE